MKKQNKTKIDLYYVNQEGKIFICDGEDLIEVPRRKKMPGKRVYILHKEKETLCKLIEDVCNPLQYLMKPKDLIIYAQ